MTEKAVCVYDEWSELSDDEGASASSDEDVMVPRRLLLKEQKTTQQLRRKLQVVQKTKRHLQERHDRVEDMLLKMLEASSTRESHCQAVLRKHPAKQRGNMLVSPMASKRARIADKPAVVRVAPQQMLPKKRLSHALQKKKARAGVQLESTLRIQNDVAGESVQPQPVMVVWNEEAGASMRQESSQVFQDDEGGGSVRQEFGVAAWNDMAGASMRRESFLGVQSNMAGASVRQEPAVEAWEDVELGQASQPSAPESAHLFEVVGGQVHLGNGVFVSAAKWKWLLLKEKDSLFVKELIKEVWGEAALHGRSVTGTPCNRFVNVKAMPKKRALTPRKLQAVGHAFDYYIQQSGRAEPDKERRSKMNRHIAELLSRQ
ncbi:uncharacterized protein LOC144142580 isoform X2 [Haemaphysalis longicornis]